MTRIKTLLLATTLILVSEPAVAAEGLSDAEAAEHCYYMGLDMGRLDGSKHDQAACILAPEKYLLDLMRINQEISAGVVKRKAKARRRAVRIPVEAQQACKAAIVRPYIRADFSFWGAKRWKAPGGRAVMKGRVEIENVLGLMVAHVYQCTFSSGGKLVSAEVTR